MTIDDLRLLIKNVFDNSTDIKEIESSVFDMIRLYEITYNQGSMFIKDRYDHKLPDKVPYHTICGCNPENGGNGICGCTIGSVMVLMQKKYEGTIKSNTTTYSDTLSCGFGICNCTSESNYTYCLTSTKTTI